MDVPPTAASQKSISGKYRCAKGAVLYQKIRPNLRKVAICSFDGLCSADIYPLRAKKNVEERFLKLVLLSEDFTKYAVDLSSRSRMPKLNQEQLFSYILPLPPFLEQRRIADLVDVAMAQQTGARASVAAQLTNIDELEAAAMEAQLGSPIAVDSKSEAPEGWSWRLIIDVARLESGHTPSRRRPEWWGGDVPWIALTDIRELDGQIAYKTAEMIDQNGLANSSARLLPTGTVVMSRTASVGFVTQMGHPMATSQDFVNWVCGPKLIPEYLVYALIVSRSRLRALSEGAIHKTIYMPTLRSLSICLPSKFEQKRIVVELNAIQRDAAQARMACAAQLAAIDALPAALLSAAFRGDL